MHAPSVLEAITVEGGYYVAAVGKLRKRDKPGHLALELKRGLGLDSNRRYRWTEMKR